VDRRTCLALLAALACSCGTSTTSGGEGLTEPVDPYGDPVVYPGDPFEGFGTVVDIAVPGSAQDATDPPAAGGWAVQIAACTSESDAAGLAAAASEELGLPSRVDHEGQWWKVRVGAYGTRLEAEEALPAVRSEGWSDAWVVEVRP
jgi:hypothetical protein